MKARFWLFPLALGGFCASAPTTAFATGTHAGGHEHASPIGEPGVPAKATRTVEVTMHDTMRFTPELIRARRGETLRLKIRNVGRLRHEFSLGTVAELEEHYAVMKQHPDMVHDEPSKITLEPGQQGEIVWRFSRAGTVHFACLHPGHYEAGMKGRVKVVRR